MILPEGKNDLKRITKNTRVIAVNMPNTKTVKSGWKNHLTTIDELEQLTGFDFLTTLPDEIENAVEAQKFAG